MFIKNKFVSLCKGQDQGESSLSGNVVKSIMSPRSEQNGVSPDYVPINLRDFEKYKRQFHTMFWEYGRLSCCLNRDYL